MSNQSRFSLLAATRHIGWGGVAELRPILEKLPCARVVLSTAMTRVVEELPAKFVVDARTDDALIEFDGNVRN